MVQPAPSTLVPNTAMKHRLAVHIMFTAFLVHSQQTNLRIG
jgi:hypothetical protein